GYSSVEVTGWNVVVQQPLAEVYATAIQMTQQSVILIILFVIVAFGIGWVFMARTTRPLHDLVAGATAIGAGNLQYTIEVESRDELGLLARTFNQMTVQLRDLIGSLEQRVADRTADLARRSTHLEAAAQVARDAAAIRDLSQLLDQTVRLISERFGFYHAGIFLVDETGEYAVLQAASSAGGRRMLAREHKLRVGEVGIVGYVAEAGEPRIALDVGEDAVFFENPNLPDTRSEMALPLKSPEGVIGVLDVQSIEPEAFTEEDVAVLQTLADQITVAISNARLFRRVQESLELERRLSGELSAQAWRTLLQAHPGLEVRRNRQGLSLRREGKTEEKEKMGEGSLTSLPIKVRGRTIGVLDARRPAGGAPWTEETQEWLEMFTEQLGTALESARLFQDTQRRATRERLVGEVTTRMRETLDMETVLKTAAREIGEALELAALDVRLSLAETPPSNAPQHKQEATGR
ncbi:MAG: GAF domain-containing protein, partial [Chloroflexota bacterium]|nr:GAF domain-containing protein [Chloroflexota bacterium]